MVSVCFLNTQACFLETGGVAGEPKDALGHWSAPDVRSGSAAQGLLGAPQHNTS